jgi:hypothetical protein
VPKGATCVTVKLALLVDFRIEAVIVFEPEFSVKPADGL